MQHALLSSLGRSLRSYGQLADLCVNKFIFFLVLLAVPLEVLHNVRLLVGSQQGVGPVPPAELKEALPL